MKRVLTDSRTVMRLHRDSADSPGTDFLKAVKMNHPSETQNNRNIVKPAITDFFCFFSVVTFYIFIIFVQV